MRFLGVLGFGLVGVGLVGLISYMRTDSVNLSQDALAEIADGSIHIYGTLRGRALAGAQGNTTARIFCREFHAELVAIAGHYKVLDDVPDTLRGKAVQVWLEQDQIKIAALD